MQRFEYNKRLKELKKQEKKLDSLKDKAMPFLEVPKGDLVHLYSHETHINTEIFKYEQLLKNNKKTTVK